MVTVEWYLYQTTLQGFVDAMLHCGNALCIKNETIKLHMRSDSFRYAKQRKGGRVRSFGGFFAWLPIDKKASSVSSKNLRIYCGFVSVYNIGRSFQSC